MCRCSPRLPADARGVVAPVDGPVPRTKAQAKMLEEATRFQQAAKGVVNEDAQQVRIFVWKRILRAGRYFANELLCSDIL